MSQPSTSYTSEKLYEEAYNIQYNWDKILPLDVLEFHTLVSKQTNAPVDLQMGTILPFVASCMGPKTCGHFLTTPSCLNLFWIVVVNLFRYFKVRRTSVVHNNILRTSGHVRTHRCIVNTHAPTYFNT